MVSSTGENRRGFHRNEGFYAIQWWLWCTNMVDLIVNQWWPGSMCFIRWSENWQGGNASLVLAWTKWPKERLTTKDGGRKYTTLSLDCLIYDLFNGKWWLCMHSWCCMDRSICRIDLSGIAHMPSHAIREHGGQRIHHSCSFNLLFGSFASVADQTSHCVDYELCLLIQSKWWIPSWLNRCLRVSSQVRSHAQDWQSGRIKKSLISLN